MRLKSLELYIDWPRDLPIRSLRSYLLEKINKIGAPVRWSIEGIMSSKKLDEPRKLRIETVVIIA